MSRRASALALALALAAPLVVAQQPPKTTPSPSLRGPIKITAERADLEHRQTALYRGNVKLVSADLILTGDRLELRQPVKGQIEAKLTGSPARLEHRGQGDVPPVAASAEQIVYDSRQAVVDLSGDAHLERGSDALSGQSILYDLAARRISASGTGKGQVQIIIRPPNGVPAENGAQNPQNTPASPGEKNQE